MKSEKTSSQIIQAIPGQRLGRVRKKQPKTDLSKLVQGDLLQEGQALYLLDYQGEKIPGYDSIISGKNLLWSNELYSMSELAKKCLKKEGFSSESEDLPIGLMLMGSLSRNYGSSISRHIKLLPQLSENAQLRAVSCQRSAIRRRILKEIHNACIKEM